MGLFNRNYETSGRGVSKNGPEKRRIWQFFEIFWNQFPKLIIANILYSITMLPLLLGLVLCFKLDFSPESTQIITLRSPGSIDLVGLIFLIISVFTSFPCTMGFTYILRNIQRREHAWIGHDLIKHTKLNYLKGVINGIVTLGVYILLWFAHGIYSSGILPLGMTNTYLSYMMIVFAMVFTWMQFYVNTMIVTFDLGMRDIYKNACIFAIGKLPLNLMITVVCVLILYLITLAFSHIPFLAFLLIFVIWYSLFGFITVFTVYPTIDKHMISKAKKKTEE